MLWHKKRPRGTFSDLMAWAGCSMQTHAPSRTRARIGEESASVRMGGVDVACDDVRRGRVEQRPGNREGWRFDVRVGGHMCLHGAPSPCPYTGIFLAYA